MEMSDGNRGNHVMESETDAAVRNVQHCTATQDGMPEPPLQQPISSQVHSQDYGQQQQQQHPLGVGNIPHSPMLPQSRTQTPFPMSTSSVAMTTNHNGVLHPHPQFLRNDADLARLSLQNHDMPVLSQQTTLSPRDHMHPTSSIHPERSHLCPTCSKGFKSKQQLAQHSLVHSGIRKHICNFCEKRFKQLCHLQQHIRIHTAEPQHFCTVCQRGFKQLSQLNQHARTHSAEHPFVCKFCEKSFKQMAHLNQHIRIHTGEKPYKCTFDGCERAFAQMANLHHHMRNHDEHVRKAANKQFHCMICHRAYTNESSLRNHTLKMHVPVKPLEHPDIIFSNLCKPRKLQRTDTGELSSNLTVDLTKDDDSMKVSRPSSPVGIGPSTNRPMTTGSLPSDRQSNFVRYLGEHLRQTLANESYNLSSSSAASTTQGLLSLHQALQEQTALLQQGRRDQFLNMEQRLQEESTFLSRNRQDLNLRMGDKISDQNSSMMPLYMKDKMSSMDQRFQVTNLTPQNRQEQNGKSQRIEERSSSAVPNRQTGLDKVGREETSLGIFQNQSEQNHNLDRRSVDQNSLIQSSLHQPSFLDPKSSEDRLRLPTNIEDNHPPSRQQLTATPHNDIRKINTAQHNDSTSSSLSKNADHLMSRFNPQSQSLGVHDHMSRHKDSMIPTMNLAHYGSQPAPFHGYPPIPMSMAMAPPAHLPHFLNSNVGPKIDNPVRVISESPLQRIVSDHHMGSLSTSSSTAASVSQSVSDSLNFSLQK